jgi:hypothetical protein
MVSVSKDFIHSNTELRIRKRREEHNLQSIDNLNASKSKESIGSLTGQQKRQIVTYMPSHISLNKEMSNKQFLRKVNNQSPTENYYFYKNDVTSRKQFDKSSHLCNCSPPSRAGKGSSFGGSLRGSSIKRGDRMKSASTKGIPDMSVPCRRGCSTIHNPRFHIGRYRVKSIKTIIKPIKIKQIHERPQSADRAKEKSSKSHENKRIDWKNAEMSRILWKIPEVNDG